MDKTPLLLIAATTHAIILAVLFGVVIVRTSIAPQRKPCQAFLTPSLYRPPHDLVLRQFLYRIGFVVMTDVPLPKLRGFSPSFSLLR